MRTQLVCKIFFNNKIRRVNEQRSFLNIQELTMKFSTTLAISVASIISTKFYSAEGTGDGIILIEDFSSPRLQQSQVNDPVMGVRSIIILLVNDHCYCQRFFLHVCVDLENYFILSLHFMFYSCTQLYNVQYVHRSMQTQLNYDT